MELPETIETERLTLRPLRPSDAGPISLYANDRRVAEMLTSMPHPYPPGAAEAFIETVRQGRAREQVWAMDALKSGGAEFIGTIGLKRKSPPELGYWVGSPFWTTGYASEAASAVASAARKAGAEKLAAQIFAENDASAHVLVNAGFIEVGAGEDFSVARGANVAVRRFHLAFRQAEA
ncbi:MAG: GNAT family N-acetyltransferase [Pseudomonadota bacterium]